MFKLVRDNIPDQIKTSGEICDYAVVQNDEFYVNLLKDKLVEEVNEFLWADATTEVDELIDVLTVLKALAAAKGITEDDLTARYTEKLEKDGGFNCKYLAFFAEQELNDPMNAAQNN